MFDWLFGNDDSGGESESIDLSQLSDDQIDYMIPELEDAWDMSGDNQARQQVIHNRLMEYYDEQRRR